MRVGIGLLVAVTALAGARFAREGAKADRELAAIEDPPYAPSPAAAPFVALGYRETMSDLMFLRLRGYFGGTESTADGIAGLVEAIIAIDPQAHRMYEYGARAITLANHGVDRAAYLRALAVLERGMTEFPDDYRLPYLAGEIYTQDLETKDPAQRRAWDEKGTLLIESAIRKPGAPAGAAAWAAVMRTKLGQRQRAIDGLREMLLVTTSTSQREDLVARLAKLENQDADEIAGELLEARHRSEAAWTRDRPALPFTMYVLLGPHPQPGYDMRALATGGRDLIGADAPERLEPLTDDK